VKTDAVISLPRRPSLTRPPCGPGVSQDNKLSNAIRLPFHPPPFFLSQLFVDTLFPPLAGLLLSLAPPPLLFFLPQRPLISRRPVVFCCAFPPARTLFTHSPSRRRGILLLDGSLFKRRCLDFSIFKEIFLKPASS